MAITVGGIGLVAPAHWKFHSFEGLILARTDAKLGTLQISTGFRDDVAAPASHASCLAVALSFSGVDPNDLSSDDSLRNGESLFGSAKLQGRADGIFYLHDGHSLLVACYRGTGDGADSELSECEEIVRSATFE